MGHGFAAGTNSQKHQFTSKNVLNCRYNCDSYLELFILTTHSTKRYPGLGTELVGQG